MLQNKFLIVKHIELKDGYVYKDKVIKEIWIDILTADKKVRTLEEEIEIAKQYGGDRLQATGMIRRGGDYVSTNSCEEKGY